MATPDLDWPRLAFEAAGSAMSALVGLLVGIWRWGRQSALREMRVKNDLNARIDAMKTLIAATEKTHDDRLDGLVDQFKESFAGLRRQIDDDRLHMEQNFVRKDDFREFREEFKADMRDIKRSIAEIKR